MEQITAQQFFWVMEEPCRHMFHEPAHRAFETTGQNALSPLHPFGTLRVSFHTHSNTNRRFVCVLSFERACVMDEIAGLHVRDFVGGGEGVSSQWDITSRTRPGDALRTHKSRTQYVWLLETWH